MKNKKSSTKNANHPVSSPKRSYLQYCLETMWAGLLGAAVGCWQP